MAVLVVEIRDAEAPRGDGLGYAVYDSVSGLVVSEAFPSQEEAEAFRDWYADPENLAMARRAVTVADLMDAWDAARGR